MVRQIFKGRVLAAAGPLPGQLTVDNLKRWTALRKGHFSEDLDDTVTHLLCTRDQFKKKVPKGMHIDMGILACLRCIRAWMRHINSQLHSQGSSEERQTIPPHSL